MLNIAGDIFATLEYDMSEDRAKKGLRRRYTWSARDTRSIYIDREAHFW